ncbi:MAG: hypothetical protein M0T76_11180, partial [Desulfobacteraceae bacterium]|nr:hypothetical protein [Desulfobacteraceae bacterium]
ALGLGRRWLGRRTTAEGTRRSLGLRGWLLGLACLAGLAANLILYGGNLLRYRALIPGLDQVLPLEDCLQNRLFVRDYAVRQFASGKLSLLDAQRLALTIRDPGDRADALDRLAQAEVDKVMGPKPRLGRWQYARNWAEVMVARTYSVAAHLSLFKNEQDFYPYYAVFILAALCWLARGWVIALPGMGVMAFVVCFYTVILMQVVNYGIYQVSGLSGLAMTGRYLFPVLAPFYLLVAHGLLARMPRWWQVTVGLAVGLWFVTGEFPWFLRHAGPEWYF